MGNEAADKAANQAQNLPGMHVTHIPCSDYHFPIRRNIMKKWQHHWDHIDGGTYPENKLKKVKP